MARASIKFDGIICGPRTDFFFGGEDSEGDGDSPLVLDPLELLAAADVGLDFLRTALRCAFESVSLSVAFVFPEFEPPDFGGGDDVNGSVDGGGADCELRSWSALGIITGSSSDFAAVRGALEAK